MRRPRGNKNLFEYIILPVSRLFNSCISCILWANELISITRAALDVQPDIYRSESKIEGFERLKEDKTISIYCRLRSLEYGITPANTLDAV